MASDRAGSVHVVVGTGYTGQRLLNSLPPDSVGLSRTEVRPEPPRRLEVLDLDRLSTESIPLPTDSRRTVVIYTVPPPPGGDSDPRLAGFLDRLTTVPKRIVYLSTTGVYGNRDGAIVDERTRTAPQTARARRRVAAEKQLEKWCGEHDAEAVILRVPGIYGPGRLGIERLKRGEPMVSDAEASPGNRVHVDDLVRCCIAAVSPQVPAGIYNLGDGDQRSATWFAAEVARQAGLPEPPIVSREEADATFSERRLSFIRESRRVDTSRMREILGVTPIYTDAAEGIRASLP